MKPDHTHVYLYNISSPALSSFIARPFAFLTLCFFFLLGGPAIQKSLGRGEKMIVEFGCVAAVSETCKVVAQERGGLSGEPPYSQGFGVKITGEHRCEEDNIFHK